MFAKMLELDVLVAQNVGVWGPALLVFAQQITGREMRYTITTR